MTQGTHRFNVGSFQCIAINDVLPETDASDDGSIGWDFVNVSADEVKQVFAGRPILEIRADQPVEAMRLLDGLPEVEKTSLFGTAVHAILRDARVTPEQVAAKLQTAGIQVERIATVAPSLEDVFLDVIDRASENVA